ncbi:MAG: trypsin-like peptidase domain-containing protein [Verrucomicrobia bacterium]|nr:trypsin-like peptidase domain-containing protein [Verrucomicrobiota bacterium]
MNRPCSHAFAVALSVAACALPLPATSATDAAAGRALVKRYADTIVGVELVVTLKLKMGDREMPPRENRVEVNGTVISASGLTVTSLAEVDPQAAFEAMRASQPGGNRVELVGADFKEVKLRLADGSEVPARFVLKDADLDLAFMAPADDADGTKRTFSAVKLEDSVEGAVLGSYFYVARAPKVLQRVPLVRTSEITGIVEKPRRFYLLTEQALGTPVFDPQGRVLGITLQNFANGRRTGYVVLPAADIAEMAKQAAARQSAPGEPAKGN